MYDDAILAVYEHLVQAHQCSADDILVTPQLRAQFVEEVSHHHRALPEKFILSRLIYLRKKGRLPRSRDLVTG